MARLTEYELDLIQQNRRPLWRAWNDPIDLLLVARRFRAAYLGKMTGLDRLGAALSAGIIDPLRQGMRRRATVRELNRLDDRLLRDIGLERAGIEAFAANLEGVDEAPMAHSNGLPANGLLANGLLANGLLANGLFARFQSWRQRRATIRQLEALDDRLLNDIGLVRGEIRQVIGGGSVDAAASAPVGSPTAEALGQSLPSRLIARPLSALSQWWRQHRTIGELRALDDRMLADIGLVRGQIPRVAAEMALPQKPATKTPAVEQPSHLGSVILTMRRWNLSRLAASQMARLGPDTLSDLGYVKGDIDWVPEVLAERTLHAKRTAGSFR